MRLAVTLPGKKASGASIEPGRVTRLLQEADRKGAIDELIEIVHDQLLAISQASLAGERHSRSLETSELVSEAYLRLVPDLERGNLKSRAHFFQAAATAMRRVLIEHARKRRRRKRGGDWRQTSLNSVRLAASEDPSEFLDLDDAIRRLDVWDPALAELVRLRFFAGMSTEDAARVLGVSESTAKRSWNFARVWLYRALNEERR